MSNAVDDYLRTVSPAVRAGASLRLFNVDEYFRMGDAGILGQKERVELLEGVIFARFDDPPAPRRFTAAEYHALAAAGVLAEDERIELIGGEIIEMSPIGSPHAACVDAFTEHLFAPLAGRAIIRVQGPICLEDHSEPEPDLSILRRRADYYRKALPRPEDVFLLVEVMATSAPVDRRLKLPRYAEAGIPEVILADLDAEHLESHREPRDGVYTLVQIRRRGETISPEAFPDVVLSVDDILG